MNHNLFPKRFTVLAACLLAGHAARAEIEIENLLANPDFANGFEHWRTSEKGTQEIRNDGRNGNATYVRVGHEDNWGDGIQQRVTLPAGTYAFEYVSRGSVAVYTSGNGFRGYKASTEPDAPLTGPYAGNASQGWTLSTRMYFTLENEAGVNLMFISAARQNPHFDVEAAFLYAVEKTIPKPDTSVEMVPDGGFNDGLLGGLPKHLKRPPNNDAAFTVVPDPSDPANPVLKVGAEEGNSDVTTCAGGPIEPYTRYRFSYKYMGEPDVFVSAWEHWGSHCFTLHTIQDEPVGNGGWKLRVLEFNSTTDARGMGFADYASFDNAYVWIKCNASATAPYYLDDISLTEIGPEPNPRPTHTIPVETLPRWVPPPQEVAPPYTPLAPRKPGDVPTGLLPFDGSLASYPAGTQIKLTRDVRGESLFSSEFYFNEDDRGDGKKSIQLWPAHGFNIENKSVPLKPNTWYRIGMMTKGGAWQIRFTFPGAHPYTADGLKNAGYETSFFIGNHWGGGYEIYAACKLCEKVWSGPFGEGRDWVKWVRGDMAGFPEKCVTDGCPGVFKIDHEAGERYDGSDKFGDLYPEFNRRRYWDWTYIHQDFRTGAYAGKMRNNVDYWYMNLICSAVETRVADFELYEIDGPGGDAVPAQTVP